MTAEELFKKNFPEYVTKKGEFLSPYWDLFSAGIECATYELNKGCIQTLTKEKAELKAQVEKMKCCENCDLNGSYAYSCNQCENESNWVMADWEGIERFYKEK